jgi:hypothetical protein
MSQYRYLLIDILSNSVQAELSFTGVNFTQSLNAAGTFNGSILLSGLPATANAANSTIPGKNYVAVDRDGIIVWAGPIWFREWDSASQHLHITAREFESYFERRRITTTQTYTNVDQLLIAKTLINNAQAVTGGNVGVITGTETSTQLVSKTYYNYELKTVYQALLDLSRSTNGFDFNIAAAYDGGGSVSKTLVLGFPQSGVRYSSSSVTAPVFEFPSGNIVEYQYPEDGSIAANTLYAIGAGSNEGMLLSTAVSSTQLAAGYPLLEDAVNYSDVTDTALLANLAAGQLAAVAYPPTTLKIVVPPYVDPVLGSYTVGSDARIRITDSRFPTGLDAVYRIVALNATPGENGPERVTLTLTLPTS